jgi:hypothetical protein
MLITPPKILVADIETNAIHNPTRFWVLGILDYHTDEFTGHVGDDDIAEGLMRLEEADLIIGHNFLGYDNKNITRLTDGVFVLDKEKIIDTVKLSRSLVKEFDTSRGGPGHGLKAWGDLFGYPKGNWDKFDRFYPEMVPYCEQDCRITKKVFDFVNEIETGIHGRINLLERANVR